MSWLKATESKRVRDLVELNQETAEHIDSYLADRLNAFLKEQIPSIAGILNIAEMVAEKVNALDPAQVERMILSVTSKQLRWVTYFGAIIGFLIGTTQAILTGLL